MLTIIPVPYVVQGIAMTTIEHKDELTREELRELLASRVQQRFHISLSTYLEARRSGALEDNGDGDLDVLAGEQARPDGPRS